MEEKMMDQFSFFIRVHPRSSLWIYLQLLESK
jgi:hypothetical protein